MNLFTTIVLAFAPVVNFFIPKSWHFFTTIIIQIAVAAFSTAFVVSQPLLYGGQASLEASNPQLLVNVDPLSILFVIIINVVSLLASIYSRGYLAPYIGQKTKGEFAIHHLSLVWLQLSMVLVVLFRDGFAFLAVWEVMTLASFLLVMFEGEKRDTFTVGVSYLIQMHFGFFLILAGFVVAYAKTGVFGFDALPLYFGANSNYLLFILFFIGFGLKAGFVPLHTWLPNAHPAAPSHVSGAMSGVMIKMGIYGIIRVVLALQQQFLEIGITVLVVALITGLWGITSAVLQKDIKRLLAYSSIENIGIIGIGMGLGIIGMHLHNNALMMFAFAGCILHIVNHSLFKPLLFMGAGSVYLATHTRRMNFLGGLIKKMPQTAVLFIIGAAAICALPPFNGFVSELLIYIGMFGGIFNQELREVILIITSLVSMALIGGLAVFAFTKVVGVTFLGSPRKPLHDVHEVSAWMLVPQYVLVALMLLVGFFPSFAVRLILPVVAQFGVSTYGIIDMSLMHTVTMISVLGLALVLFCVFIFFVRSKMQGQAVVSEGPTWGCGYTAIDARQEYTSTSYADSLLTMARPMVKVTKDFKPIGKMEFFPQSTTFASGSDDPFEELVTARPTNRLMRLLRKAAILQTGMVQHYILYAVLFIAAILLLTYLKLM